MSYFEKNFRYNIVFISIISILFSAFYHSPAFAAGRPRKALPICELHQQKFVIIDGQEVQVCREPTFKETVEAFKAIKSSIKRTAEMSTPVVPGTVNRREYKIPRHGFLGVSVSPVPPEMTQSLSLDWNFGVIVQSVMSGEAADKAGIREGDIIVTVDDHAINENNTLNTMIGMRYEGQVVRLGILTKEFLFLQYKEVLLGGMD